MHKPEGGLLKEGGGFKNIFMQENELVSSVMGGSTREYLKECAVRHYSLGLNLGSAAD